MCPHEHCYDLIGTRFFAAMLGSKWVWVEDGWCNSNTLLQGADCLLGCGWQVWDFFRQSS